MRLLEGAEEEEAREYIRLAADKAKASGCSKSPRGAVIVKDGAVIGSGTNSPPLDEKCLCCLRESIHNNSRAELCRSVHAEQNAMLDALKKGFSLDGSTLYHAKFKGGEVRPSDDISCTVCSRLIMQSGISQVVLLQTAGIFAYSAREFNDLSFSYFNK